MSFADFLYYCVLAIGGAFITWIVLALYILLLGEDDPKHREWHK